MEPSEVYTSVPSIARPISATNLSRDILSFDEDTVSENSILILKVSVSVGSPPAYSEKAQLSSIMVPSSTGMGALGL
jgi:hypothetical protein